MQEGVRGGPYCEVAAACVHQDVELPEKSGEQSRNRQEARGFSFAGRSVSLHNTQGEASTITDKT